MPRVAWLLDAVLRRTSRTPSTITDAVGWKGGGYRYYRLAPSLLERDRGGHWVINKTYNAAMLAEALCKLEGFTYAPFGCGRCDKPSTR